MLFQNLVQVYSNSDGDAVIVYGKLDDLSKPITPEIIIFDISEARAIGEALIKLADEASEFES
jgi:hypothetical protein